MKRTMMFATALAAGLTTLSLIAQDAPAAQTPAAAAAAAPAPEALPAKVAVIAFEQAVVATNEGQKALADIGKKYEPKKTQLETLNKEIEGLKAKLQALPANAPDEQRTPLLREIDTKEKALQRDSQDASDAYNGEVQEALGKVAQKLGATAVKYAQDNGFTVLLNVDANQNTPNPVFWWNQKTDISLAVVNEYNKVSGVAAPPPSAPAPTHTTRPAGAATKPAGGATTTH